jgi:hypothetical protein
MAHLEIPLTGHVMTAAIGTLAVWQHANFSKAWYQDALRESKGEEGKDSKRREIVFAASFLETYIFEWVRQIRIDLTDVYFPAEPRFEKDHRFGRGLKEKWKEIPGELHKDGYISLTPDLDLSQLGMLVLRRNGLLHGRASRPLTEGLTEKQKPLPALDEWDKITHGWACNVARELVSKLHSDLNMAPPDYL